MIGTYDYENNKKLNRYRQHSGCFRREIFL